MCGCVCVLLKNSLCSEASIDTGRKKITDRFPIMLPAQQCFTLRLVGYGPENKMSAQYIFM